MTLVATAREVATSYMIEWLGGTGTMFAWKDEQGTFFVTARHVLKNAAEGDTFRLWKHDGWQNIRIREISHSSTDVCVFSTMNFSLTFNGHYGSYPEAAISPGGETIFVGYPHGLFSNHAWPDGFTTALVRKAFFSGVITDRGAEWLVLDGFNNPGYSGSPVYMGHNGHLVPLGVISGYRFEKASHGAVYKSDGHGGEEPMPGIWVRSNSGMIEAVPWKYVDDCLATLKTRNPISPRANL